MSHKVITRFAPSPTGFLHIGSARTALFNYLFAKHHGGKFLLRIEDTDYARSTQEATDAIFTGLKWLGLDWNDDAVFQSHQITRHAAVAQELLAGGRAYLCFSSQEEIDAQRQEALANNQPFLFKSPWRNKTSQEYPQDVKPVIRLKVPENLTVQIIDNVQGSVEIHSDHLDDMVLVRANGLPTYMLAVVVDDYDMGVTHIIRGDDHFTNAARQILIYQAMGWPVPNMTHIPLICGDDGHKLSKRHGALGVEAYKEMGYLPEAMFNYLLRLGWSHGNDEIISKEQAINWFNLENLGASPARIDFAKMKQLNAHYIQQKNNEELLAFIDEQLQRENIKPSTKELNYINKALPELKLRAELMGDLLPLCKIFLVDHIPFEMSEEALSLLKSSNQELIREIIAILKNDAQSWDKSTIQHQLKQLATSKGIKVSALMPILRSLVTGTLSGMSILDIIEILQQEETLRKVEQACSQIN